NRFRDAVERVLTICERRFTGRGHRERCRAQFRMTMLPLSSSGRGEGQGEEAHKNRFPSVLICSFPRSFRVFCVFRGPCIFALSPPESVSIRVYQWFSASLVPVSCPWNLKLNPSRRQSVLSAYFAYSAVLVSSLCRPRNLCPFA